MAISRITAKAVLLASTASLVAMGCRSKTESPTAASIRPVVQQLQTYPRPAVAPATFKVFHKSDTTYTLVVPEDATDEQVESLIWELRDAAHARTLDKLKISQKMVDERKPLVWFHIYRGSKCASEKYADGPPPCGGSYHAAGDFTYGGYKNKDADSGVILHGEDHETQLWDPEVPYAAKGSGS
jgi:hypothetical protein